MKVSEQIIQVLDALCEKFGMAIDWTADNVIPYIEKLCGKYINYEIATSIVWIVVALAMCIPGFILFKLLNKNKEWGVEHFQYTGDCYFGRIMSYIGVAAIFVIPFLMVIVQALDITTCLTFPEKVIIDELKILIN